MNEGMERLSNYLYAIVMEVTMAVNFELCLLRFLGMSETEATCLGFCRVG